eukprot:57725_1
MQSMNTVYHLISISALLRGSLAYYVVYNPSQEYSWPEAQTYCETTYGTNLATVTTQTDLNGLIELRDSNGNSDENSWIGLNDRAVEGQMQWISGKPCELISNLCVTTGEPNDWEGNGGEDCVDIAYADYNYAVDGPCDAYKRKQFFCDDKQYNLVNDGSTERSWPEAEAYCLETYGTHLATVPTSTDLNLLIKIRDNNGDSNEPSWIGLNDRSVEGRMQWISGAPCEINNDLCVDYWKTDEPNDWEGNGGEDCVDIAQSDYNYAGDGPCDDYKRKQFFCDVTDAFIRQYYLVYDSSGSWSWHQAQQYCETTYGTNLATVTTQVDLNELILMRNTYGNSDENCWIGLNDRVEEGNMRWISNKPCELNNNLCVTYWKTGEPNDWEGNGGEDCVDIAYADYNYAVDGPCDAY